MQTTPDYGLWKVRKRSGQCVASKFFVQQIIRILEFMDWFFPKAILIFTWEFSLLQVEQI